MTIQSWRRAGPTSGTQINIIIASFVNQSINHPRDDKKAICSISSVSPHLESALGVTNLLDGKDPDAAVEAVHENGPEQGSSRHTLLLWKRKS